jgi:hypothetical protein
MNRYMLGMVAVTALASTGAWAQAAPQSAEEYKAAVSRAEADYRVARERCNTSAGTTKAICVAEAKAAEKRAKADAMVAHKNTDQSRIDARVEYAEADYMVAKERCREQGGNARDICMEEARAAETKAKADAKADAKASATADSAAKDSSPNEEAVQSRETPPAAATGERAAARAQCDQMSGNAREECISAAERPGRM